MNTMSVIHRGASSIAVDLGVGPSARIIERAIRMKASVLLEFRPEVAEQTVAGVLTAGTRDTLTVEVHALPPGTVLQSSCCDVTVVLDEQEHLFAARVVEVSGDGRQGEVVLDRPGQVQVWQRRKFVRASVADSATAHFSAPGDYDRACFDGAVLNVSPDGMACKVGGIDADGFAVDERVGVLFSLGAIADPIALDATIKTKTPGGTPGVVIVGVQFIVDDKSRTEHNRLREALQSYL